MEQTKELSEIMQKFGHFVKTQRVAKGITQEEFCEKLNEMNPNIKVDKYYVSKLENNKLESVRLETMSSMVSVLGGKVSFS